MRWIDWLLEAWMSSHEGLSMKVAIIGLDNAGKTTMLYRLKLGQEVVTTVPTIGFNMESVQCKGISFDCWDIGGQERVRPLWRYYFQGINAVIFVIDSSDVERVPEARRELHKYVLLDESLRGAPILVFANKQDVVVPEPLSVAELSEELGLPLQSRHPIRVQGCSATGGEGILEGLMWLSQVERALQKGGSCYLHRLQKVPMTRDHPWPHHLPKETSAQHSNCTLFQAMPAEKEPLVPPGRSDRGNDITSACHSKHEDGKDLSQPDLIDYDDGVLHSSSSYAGGDGGPPPSITVFVDNLGASSMSFNGNNAFDEHHQVAVVHQQEQSLISSRQSDVSVDDGFILV